jgi:hypothetical protein
MAGDLSIEPVKQITKSGVGPAAQTLPAGHPQ